MKNKKTIFIVGGILLAIVLGFTIFHFLTKEDKVTTLTLFEKQWIESNKNNVIDMSIINDIPIISYNGEGLIVDFLESLNKETNLSFNKVSYKLNEEVKTPYAIKAVDQVNDKDILIYEDNYVILSKKNIKYNNIEQLKDLKIGILNENVDKVNNYLFNSGASFQGFEDISKLLAEYDKEGTTLDAIVLLKTSNLKTIFEKEYTISYNINDYKKYFVLSLGDAEKLNTILVKYYNKWSKENYTDSYNKYLSKNYFNFNKINDSESVKFRSKRYTYGYIENSPFDTLLDNKLAGINNQLLSSFSKLTNAEISYKKYDTIEDLLLAFNTNQIDFYYAMNSNDKYAIDVYKTAAAYDNSLVVLKHHSNEKIVNTIKSLSNVITLQDSVISKYLSDNGVSISTYKDMEDISKNITDDSIILMDLANYNYYKQKLKDFVISYQTEFEDYSFQIRNITDNKVFSEFFDFYLGFTESQRFVNRGLNQLLSIDNTPFILKTLAIILGSVVGLLLIVLGIIKLKPKKKKLNLSKEDKLRYIDALTSLKNRNFLNDSVERWDSSEVYPQTIVIIDLNNIAYINDNYGHAEGDAVIKQAANIIILNQIENSEIIRTNGNEFLIYLVGHEEKQVITYMRKLNKELKELNHSFGAAVGYSMINDAIKTVDDAINEATLDMRNNKEEASN